MSRVIEKNMLPGRNLAYGDLGDVLILGLGKSGIAVCRYCAKELGSRVKSLTVYAGEKSKTVQDLPVESDADGLNIHFGEEKVEGRYDLCVASPGISEFSELYQSAAKASRELISEVEFAWRESRDTSEWIAVTGTNGKTTTTALIAHILKKAGLAACAVGNIGDTCTESVMADDCSVYVAELSSFQLASTVCFAPRIAVLLNITPDHLSWHTTFESYVQAKLNILRNLAQVPDAVAILDATNEIVRGQVRVFKATERKHRGFDYIPLGAACGLEGNMKNICGSDNAAYILEGNLCLDLEDRGHRFGALEDLSIKGMHNAGNALAAASAACVLGVSDEDIAQGLSSFAALEHRIEPCGSVEGVSCYNDSKATNVDAALQAFTAFGEKRPLVLLGGYDKGTDLADLVVGAEDHCKAVICFGAARERFSKAFARARVDCYTASSLEEALDIALANAQKGDVVALSPACSSFDEFTSFEHRGTTFKNLVARRMAARGA